jgi:formamidopyrimidine-DNA glycosylase
LPELPEVETVRRGLEPHMVGRRIVRTDQNRADLRFPFPDKFTDRLSDQYIEAVVRRAKYLLLYLSSSEVLIMHLGMSGSFRIEQNGTQKIAAEASFIHERQKQGKHDHCVFHLDDGTSIIFNDPRRFGFMMLENQASLEQHPLFAKLGPEPLGNSFSAMHLAEAFRNKSTPLKSALLDQRVVAGLGNIYVCEALFQAGLKPTRKAGSIVPKKRLPGKNLENLETAIRGVLAKAIQAGGSSLRDHKKTDGTMGYFQHSFSVYGREGEACKTPGCKSAIKRIVQSGRSSFYCPACQS